MDTAVAIRTLEATYKSSSDAAAVETMILKLTEKVYFIRTFCFFIKNKADVCHKRIVDCGGSYFSLTI